MSKKNENDDKKYTASLKMFSQPVVYDLLLGLSRFGKNFFKEKVLGECTFRGDERVLDIGCGTGTLLHELKKMHPNTDVHGLDPDKKLIDHTSAKLQASGFGAVLKKGFAQELPHETASFDYCFSTLVFHHLRPPLKKQAFEELYRVLTPGGHAVIVDFKKIKYPFLAWLYIVQEDYQSLHSNFSGDLEKLIHTSPFTVIKNIRRSHSLVEIYILRKPM